MPLPRPLQLLLAAAVLAPPLAGAALAQDAAAPARLSPPVLHHADAPPLAVNRGDWVAITGENLDPVRGRIWLGERRVKVRRQDWGENVVLFQVPDDLPFGRFEVAVTNRGGRVTARPLVVEPPPPRILPVPHMEQLGSEHCWAAVVSMILAMHQIDMAQCDLATFLALRLETTFPHDCCVDDENAPAASACNTPAPDLDAILDILATFGGLRARIVEGTLEFDDLRFEIDSGRPLILGYQNELAGHVVLAYGYDETFDTVWIHDSAEGSFEVPFEELFRYYDEQGELRWVESVVEIE